MTDFEIRAQEKTAGVQWGQFILALVLAIITIFSGIYGLLSARDTHAAEQDSRLKQIETRIGDADLTEIPVKLQRIEDKVDELLRRRH